jgi:uncharacterized protein
MGKGEFAFAPSGNVYLCERLIGSDEGKEHCLGNVNDGIVHGKTSAVTSSDAINKECLLCGLKDYCINWCGCINYHSTGSYNIVSHFMCALEKVAIIAAFDIIRNLNNFGLDFSHHLVGLPLMNVIAKSVKRTR